MLGGDRDTLQSIRGELTSLRSLGQQKSFAETKAATPPSSIEGLRAVGVYGEDDELLKELQRYGITH